MTAYSMDLRKRVLRAWDGGMDAEAVAAKYDVSRAWVHRLVQRRRETGAIAPRQQTKFRRRVLEGQEGRLVALILAKPDATLAELRDALPTNAALSTLWRAIDRLGFTVKKKRYTPTNNAALTWPRRVGSGSSGSRCATCASMCFSMNAA
jgi:transposase